VAQRRIVPVSGSSAAGKTTQAAPLAHRRGLPLIAKDGIDESLAEQVRRLLGQPGSS
jgi:adenylate kinase family enzyme